MNTKFRGIELTKLERTDGKVKFNGQTFIISDQELADALQNNWREDKERAQVRVERRSNGDYVFFVNKEKEVFGFTEGR